MSYYQYFDSYYKQLILSGQYPYPYGYTNYSKIPSISNPGCREQFFGEIGNELANCPRYYDINLCELSFAPIPVVDPCLVQNFIVRTLVSNVPPLAPPPHPVPVAAIPPPPVPEAVLPTAPESVSPSPVPAPLPPVVPPPVKIIPKFKTVPVKAPQPVSNAFVDSNMLDPWGVLVMNDVVWVANAGSGMLTGYNLVGQPLFMVNVFGPFNNIAHPVALACNSCLKSFLISRGPATAASLIVIATRHGTIHGYNANIDPYNSFVIINRNHDKCIYTGIAIVNRTIYATDFYNQKIDVFGPDLQRIDDFPFVDEYSSDPIPGDFAPFNIVNIDDFLYVTYAKQNPSDCQFEKFGKGFGYISIFTPTGRFVKRFASGGVLNAPWGLVLAPNYFGYPAGSIMVSNIGNGNISIFGPDGDFIGNMRDCNYVEIVIPGLRGIALNPNFLELVYWTASRNRYQEAFMGTINVGK